MKAIYPKQKHFQGEFHSWRSTSRNQAYWGMLTLRLWKQATGGMCVTRHCPPMTENSNMLPLGLVWQGEGNVALATMSDWLDMVVQEMSEEWTWFRVILGARLVFQAGHFGCRVQGSFSFSEGYQFLTRPLCGCLASSLMFSSSILYIPTCSLKALSQPHQVIAHLFPNMHIQIICHDIQLLFGFEEWMGERLIICLSMMCK